MTASDPIIKRALISVSDKTGLIEFARALRGRDIEILSTGGTARAIADAGLAVRDVSDLTGFPEIMDGRVKTLHPKVHGGLLAVRGDDAHRSAQADHDIPDIDLLVVNLYPFEATVARGAAFDECIENIDIGGPAMIRAASKNHTSVTVIVDPGDYQQVLAELEETGGATRRETRARLAAKAYSRTGAYDAAISSWFAAELGGDALDYRAFGGRLQQSLRYGENPHQEAAFYVDGTSRPGVATARQVQGKELSYNNINDTDAAFECMGEFGGGDAAVVIVKHANPCGVATAATLRDAYRMALRCDPVSAFGGIVALNRTIDASVASDIVEIFTEVIIAPDASEEALEIIGAKKNLRLLLTGALPDPATPGTVFKSVAGGLLMQSRDSGVLGNDDLRVVTSKSPDTREMADLRFAWRVAKHVKSNAIVYALDGATVGIGAGQMSRVDSARIAAFKSGEAARAAGIEEPLAQGSVVASDAFFPFPDGLLQAAEAGATAVIQPGGSMRDGDVIAAANEAGLAMVFTGKRHFRH